ncbi:MAG: hypothetical protein IKY59_07435 [Oscillospiraceae bacterium]|nr:hypothetical protein [Oscillospiraceae bacterium]
MKRRIILLVCVLMLCGCSGKNTAMDAALGLRSSIAQANCCKFSVKIIADYGNVTYEFSMDCESDREGNVQFTVTQPETIAGITGRVTANGGKLTFDDQMLYIPMLTDDQITPISGPWILMRSLLSGCITSCTEGRITIDDSYEDDALKLDIFLDEAGTPDTVDVYWKNRRILLMNVTSFVLT